uniref:Cleavage inducing molecular chaperone Jiv domain-containing protein n=1 Tax=Panagrolaimus superbus TaxID=310955 RepID=A0A914ZB35_9BILA
MLDQTYALQIQLDEYKYLINTKGAILHCECGENHTVTRVSNYDGRYCIKCNQSHPVKNGDLWVDKQYFGWVLTYYAVINNTIFDVTDWGNCAANCLKRLKPNPHMITHRLYNASVNAAVTNVTEKHRCSCRPDSSDRCTRSIVLPKDPLPWKYSCCCSLLLQLVFRKN